MITIPWLRNNNLARVFCCVKQNPRELSRGWCLTQQNTGQGNCAYSNTVLFNFLDAQWIILIVPPTWICWFSTDLNLNEHYQTAQSNVKYHYDTITIIIFTISRFHLYCTHHWTLKLSAEQYFSKRIRQHLTRINPIWSHASIFRTWTFPWIT